MQRFTGQFQFFLTMANCLVEHKLHEVWQMINILSAEKNVATTSSFFYKIDPFRSLFYFFHLHDTT